MTAKEIVAACKARGCCPLGAAMGGRPKVPFKMCPVASLLGISVEAASGIAMAWDDGSHETAVLKAQAFGLGPRMEAFLSGGNA